jgi:hypothetical protein
MLRKMLVHGLAAAILIGSAAAVYAEVKGNGYLSPAMAQTKIDDKATAKGGDGSSRPSAENVRKGEDRNKHGGKSKRHHDGREGGHDKDD